MTEAHTSARKLTVTVRVACRLQPLTAARVDKRRVERAKC